MYGAMPKGWGAPGTADLVRVYLLARGKGTPYGVTKFIRVWLEVKYGPKGKHYEPPNYQSMRNLFSAALKLGLIQDAGRGPADNPYGFQRHYYRVTPGRERDPAWRNPKLARYEPEKFRKVNEIPRRVLNKTEIEEVVAFLDEHPEL
jgi:hypothetical protein